MTFLTAQWIDEWFQAERASIEGFDGVFAEPLLLGFGDPFLVCCVHGGKYNFNIAMRCGWTKMVNGTKTVIAKSCEDPSSRIMWDGLHFTEVANRWIYNQIADGAYSDPPIPLKTACHRMI
ncbi:putative alpha-L-fucosidase [Helianthus annuus]|uniref:Alpha-L-fucosidase n=2 Tax=Helianthus annuus TaxID=4232 RepID=A0A9K3I0A4_HELAN|nr:putative alpha-L-fucosidase [Helianthus annuus]